LYKLGGLLSVAYKASSSIIHTMEYIFNSKAIILTGRHLPTDCIFPANAFIRYGKIRGKIKNRLLY